MPSVGEIWAANFAYEDDPLQTKLRPALVISADQSTCVCILLAVSSRTPKPNYDYPIKYWQAAGLSKPSCVRLESAVEFVFTDLEFKIGKLHQKDQNGVFWRSAELYENENENENELDLY